MTLNKQRILSELGSVVNQLQNADCGCIGKLFGNQCHSNMAAPIAQHGGYGHPCCHGLGNNFVCDGAMKKEPYSMNSMNNQQPYSCMGRCNPPKLYADTYNYLNENLMQPVVKEVYHDLKSISPANTIMNNGMAAKLGFNQTQQGPMTPQNQLTNQNSNNINTFSSSNPMKNTYMMANAQMPNAQMQNNNMMSNTQMHNSGTAYGQQNLGGMGPQIMNMIHGESIVNSSQPQQGHKMLEPMLIDAPQSPHGKVGVTPINTSNTYNNIPSQNYVNNNANMSNQQNVFVPNVANPNMQLPNSSPQSQIAQQKPNYGQHDMGMKKFNEMFPGVVQGLGGDLGFDPMAIAIQMNPANQQQVAMKTMQNMMNNNQNITKLMDNPTQPTRGQNTIAPVQNALPNQLQGTPLNQVQNNNLSMVQAQLNQENVAYQNQPLNQTASQNQHQPNANIPLQNQQVYQASVDPQQGQLYGMSAVPESSQMSVPNTISTTQPNLATVREDFERSQPPQHTIKEPIFPADTTKQKVYTNPHHRYANYADPAYNTLGQPVEKLPGNIYRHPIPPLPQTLSPQPVQYNKKYSNVKATVSKTSLMDNKPVGQAPSRSQLQHIYNQYKGSQSFTQQNVKVPAEVVTHSERRLSVPAKEVRQQDSIPVEKNGGDSLVNRQNNDQKMNFNQTNGQIGDVPQNIKPDLIKEEKDIPSNNRKSRNGLQDVVYTSYPTSTAWSFHGGDHVISAAHRRYSRYRY